MQGAPCAVMGDLGRTVTLAANRLLADLGLAIPILACHLHFLKDIGTDLLLMSMKKGGGSRVLERTNNILKAFSKGINIMNAAKAAAKYSLRILKTFPQKQRSHIILSTRITWLSYVVPWKNFPRPSQRLTWRKNKEHLIKNPRLTLLLMLNCRSRKVHYYPPLTAI